MVMSAAGWGLRQVRVRVIGGRGGGGGAGSLRWRAVGGRWMKVKLNSVHGTGPRQVGGGGRSGGLVPEAEQWVAEIETSGALSKDEWTRM